MSWVQEKLAANQGSMIAHVTTCTLVKTQALAQRLNPTLSLTNVNLGKLYSHLKFPFLGEMLIITVRTPHGCWIIN